MRSPFMYFKETQTESATLDVSPKLSKWRCFVFCFFCFFGPKLPRWSQTWTASPSGSARDRWGSSRCLWMSWLHTRRPDMSHLTWSWGWGCRDEYLQSLHSLCPWLKSVINGKWTVFLKHFYCIVHQYSESSHKCAFTHSRCLAQGRCENLQSRGLGLNQRPSITRATLSSRNKLTFEWMISFSLNWSHRFIDFIPWYTLIYSLLL